MRGVVFAAACLGFLGGARMPAWADGCTLTHRATVPLIEAENGYRLLVDARMDGTPIRLMVDTGAVSFLLNEKVAQRANTTIGIGTLIAGTDSIGTSFVTGIGGARVTTVINIEDFRLGKLRGEFKAAMTDDPSLFATDHVDGLLGMSMLGEFDIDFDLPEGQLRLYSASGDCAQPTVALDQPLYAVPLERPSHDPLRILVPVLVNGQNFTARLDTGTPDIVVFADAAAKLGLVQPGAKSFKGGGVGGTVRMTTGRLDRLAIGQIALRNVPVTVDPENTQGADMLLGIPFMHKVHVWVSNSSNTLIMQYPPAGSPALGSGP